MNFLADMFSPRQMYVDLTTGWTWGSRLWLISAVALILGISLHWGETPVAILSSVTGVICVILVAKGKVSNYAFGLVNVLLYGYVAYNATYYGDAILNWAFYVPVQFIGFYYWARKYTGVTDTVIMKRMTPMQYLVSGIIIAFAITGAAFALEALGDRLPIHDALTTVLSIAATILMIARYREQWVCWIIINIVSVYMWVSYTMTGEGTGIAALMMWMVFLANSIYGYWLWTKLAKTHEDLELEHDDNEQTEHI